MLMIMVKEARTRQRTGLDEIFTLRDAHEAGWSHRAIYEMRDRGEIVSLGDGLYRRDDAAPADLDLIEIAERVPQATLCLETALAHHGLVDAIPTSIDFAIPRGNHRPRLSAPHRLHSFDRHTFDIGRETIDVGARRQLGIYSAERCIVDMVRLRHDQGPEQAWEALRNWLRLRGSSPGRLARMATHFRGAEKPLLNAFAVLL